jgi:hypothetical protein
LSDSVWERRDSRGEDSESERVSGSIHLRACICIHF